MWKLSIAGTILMVREGTRDAGLVRSSAKLDSSTSVHRRRKTSFSGWCASLGHKGLSRDGCGPPSIEGHRKLVRWDRLQVSPGAGGHSEEMVGCSGFQSVQNAWRVTVEPRDSWVRAIVRAPDLGASEILPSLWCAHRVQHVSFVVPEW